MRSARFLGLLLALGVLAGGVPYGAVARAEPRVGPVDRPVLVHVMVVHAKVEPGPIDPGCVPLKRKLGMMNFRTLRMLQQQRFKLQMGQQARMQLPAGRHFEILPISVIDRELHMQVQMPGMLNTRVRMPSGDSMILGGLAFEDGVLVLQLKPEFRLPRPPSAAARHKRELRRLRHLGAYAAGH